MVVRTDQRRFFQGRGERASPLLGGEGWVRTVVKSKFCWPLPAGRTGGCARKFIPPKSCGAADDSSPRRQPWVKDIMNSAPEGAKEWFAVGFLPPLRGLNFLRTIHPRLHRGLLSAAPPALRHPGRLVPRNPGLDDFNPCRILTMVAGGKNWHAARDQGILGGWALNWGEAVRRGTTG
jgi:hypothetical protein